MSSDQCSNYTIAIGGDACIHECARLPAKNILSISFTALYVGLAEKVLVRPHTWMSIAGIDSIVFITHKLSEIVMREKTHTLTSALLLAHYLFQEHSGKKRSGTKNDNVLELPLNFSNKAFWRPRVFQGSQAPCSSLVFRTLLQTERDVNSRGCGLYTKSMERRNQT